MRVLVRMFIGLFMVHNVAGERARTVSPRLPALNKPDWKLDQSIEGLAFRKRVSKASS